MINLELTNKIVEVGGRKRIKRTVWRPRNLKQFMLGAALLSITVVAIVASLIAMGFALYAIS